MVTQVEEVRQQAEGDLYTFIRLVAPHRVLGSIHEEVLGWWTRQEARSHSLLLLPRAHQKSMLMAYRVAWEITKDPAITVLYISSTSNLAEKQLKAIQDILTSPIYTRYWPEMIHPQDGKREKWTTTEISVDHPKRSQEGIRDATVFTAGLTTSITGLHCDLTIMDDVVVKENAYTSEGRRKVQSQYSLLSSIENPGARQLVAGTRYHAKDLYNDLVDMKEEIYDEKGEMTGESLVYEVMQREVEDRGDGSGEYLWPRQRRIDGKWYGFNQQILARKKAQYLDRAQFYAQYYNNPNDPSDAEINRDQFQYYNKSKLSQRGMHWYYGDVRLNLFASIDFAFSLRDRADYTAIVVIGIDAYRNIYILDIDRFKTSRIKEYFEHILALHNIWGFRSMRAEVTVAQQTIVKELKEQYIKEHGLALKVDEYRPTRNEGTKEERVSATLEPRYDNGAMWHYRGGNCQTLEEELIMRYPPHDDIKDALASAIGIAIPPRAVERMNTTVSEISTHPRFGGIT